MNPLKKKSYAAYKICCLMLNEKIKEADDLAEKCSYFSCFFMGGKAIVTILYWFSYI